MGDIEIVKGTYWEAEVQAPIIPSEEEGGKKQKKTKGRRAKREWKVEGVKELDGLFQKTGRVPQTWHKYLGFARTVPDHLVPSCLAG